MAGPSPDPDEETLVEVRATFRNVTYRWVAVVNIVGAGVLAGWIAQDSDALDVRLVVLGIFIVVAILSYRFYWRPVVVLMSDRLVVVNPLRTTTVSLDQVSGLSADTMLRVELRSGERLAAWAVQSANLAKLVGREGYAEEVRRWLEEAIARLRRSSPPHAVGGGVSDWNEA